MSTKTTQTRPARNSGPTADNWTWDNPELKDWRAADHGMKDRWEPGEPAQFQYSMGGSHDSGFAELWYRSQQPVTVLRMVKDCDGYGLRNLTMAHRSDACMPLGYIVRFADGYEGHATEDELLVSTAHFEPQLAAPPKSEIDAVRRKQAA